MARPYDPQVQPDIQYKAVPVGGFEVDNEDEGVVTAIVAVTGIVDEVRDVIEPGAFQKTLSKRTPRGVWSHDWDTPVSKTISVEELMPGDARLPKTTANGDPWPSEAGALMVKTQFNLGTQRGREAFADVKFFGDAQQWSIGYNVPASGSTTDRKSGLRHIQEMDLYEYSPVLFGAMPLAATMSVKSAQIAAREGKGVRRVRTPEGARQYGQPIGSVIKPNASLPNLPDAPKVPNGGGAMPSGSLRPTGDTVERRNYIATAVLTEAGVDPDEAVEAVETQGWHEALVDFGYTEDEVDELMRAELDRRGAGPDSVDGLGNDGDGDGAINIPGRRSEGAEGANRPDGPIALAEKFSAEELMAALDDFDGDPVTIHAEDYSIEASRADVDEALYIASSGLAGRSEGAYAANWELPEGADPLTIAGARVEDHDVFGDDQIAGLPIESDMSGDSQIEWLADGRAAVVVDVVTEGDGVDDVLGFFDDLRPYDLEATKVNDDGGGGWPEYRVTGDPAQIREWMLNEYGAEEDDPRVADLPEREPANVGPPEGPPDGDLAARVAKLQARGIEVTTDDIEILRAADAADDDVQSPDMAERVARAFEDEPDEDEAREIVAYLERTGDTEALQRLVDSYGDGFGDSQTESAYSVNARISAAENDLIEEVWINEGGFEDPRSFADGINYAAEELRNRDGDVESVRNSLGDPDDWDMDFHGGAVALLDRVSADLNGGDDAGTTPTLTDEEVSAQADMYEQNFFDLSEGDRGETGFQMSVEDVDILDQEDEVPPEIIAELRRRAELREQGGAEEPAQVDLSRFDNRVDRAAAVEILIEDGLAPPEAERAIDDLGVGGALVDAGFSPSEIPALLERGNAEEVSITEQVRDENRAGAENAAAFTVGAESMRETRELLEAGDVAAAFEAIDIPVSRIPPALRDAHQRLVDDIDLLQRERRGTPDYDRGRDDAVGRLIALATAIDAFAAWQQSMFDLGIKATHVDAETKAKGGADKNRGGAEHLRRYWTRGAGAAKIGWGTPGDFKRCVALLTEHMPGRAEGYCALRHKEATGEWAGPNAHGGKKELGPVDNGEYVHLLPPSDLMLDLQEMQAEIEANESYVPYDAEVHVDLGEGAKDLYTGSAPASENRGLGDTDGVGRLEVERRGDKYHVIDLSTRTSLSTHDTERAAIEAIEALEAGADPDDDAETKAFDLDLSSPSAAEHLLAAVESDIGPISVKTRASLSRAVNSLANALNDARRDAALGVDEADLLELEVLRLLAE